MEKFSHSDGLVIRISNNDAEFILFALSHLRESYDDFIDKRDREEALETVERLLDVFTNHSKIEIGE